MRTVKEIIEVLAGGVAGLRHHPIKIENEPYMVLCIEWIGTGLRGFPLVSIAHYFEQNGDLMRDPDIEAEYDAVTDNWFPLSFRQDSTGTMQEVSRVHQGRVQVDKRPYEQLRLFMVVWDRNIREQGFLTEAKRMAAEGEQACS
jgi:hypothetical protein